LHENAGKAVGLEILDTTTKEWLVKGCCAINCTDEDRRR
jgi:hypothetical protein